MFQSLEQQIGDHVVDASAPGDVALDAADCASRGGPMPKVMKDFIKANHRPQPRRPDYSEARQAMPQKPVKPHSALSENRVDEAMGKRNH